MKLLVVEGNPKRIWQPREAQGGMPYHRRFVQMLGNLGYAKTEVAFPVEGEQLPSRRQLQQYSGILLTGSSLNAYDDSPEVSNQLDFADACFASGVPIYGSCWGVQVAVMVAGGKIAKGKNGREFGIAQDITLTAAGRKSPFFQGKPSVFDAYCIHEDDTQELPANSELLASNAHSAVQALTIRHGKSHFFGVQYHPEFTYDDVRFLAKQMEKKFVEEGIYSTQKNQDDYIRKWLRHPYVNDTGFHTVEINNWLKLI